jgi:hypothetical protein
MAQRFAQYERRLSEAVDRTYGETLRVIPQAVGEFLNTDDPDRLPYNTVGPVDFNPVVATPKAIGKSDGDSVQVSGERVHVSLHSDNLPVGAAFPQQGDLIELLERDGLPRVRVMNREPDGIGRVILKCVRMGKA